jgi:hypothetical protein
MHSPSLGCPVELSFVCMCGHRGDVDEVSQRPKRLVIPSVGGKDQSMV